MTHRWRCSVRIGAVVAAAVGAAALLHGVARSQSPPELATIQISTVGRAPRRGTTAVNLSFVAPPGFRITRRPRVVVVNDQGQLVEFLPVFITHGPPTGQGHRELHSYAYPPGTYRVRAEFDFTNAAGVAGRAVSPEVSFSVTGR